MNILLFALWLILLIISFFRNQDLFTPSKIYLVILLTFFGDSFWSNSYTLDVYFSVFWLLNLSIVILILEKRIKVETSSIELNSLIKKRLFIRIWLLTAIPIFAQIYLFQKFGGFKFFISSISGRVVEWQGLGFVILLTKTMNILNYLYFILIIKIKNISKLQLSLFIVHVVLFISIALLSGSRSNLLWNFVFMLIFYNYSIRKVTIKIALLGFISILTFAMVIGVARSGYVFEDGEIKTGISHEKGVFETTNFKYGLQPIEKVFEKGEITNLYLGSTYITAITNLIPRKIWPKKPPTGGVIITEEYFDNPYGGYSNYSTGIIPEAIINFGYIGGFLFSFLQLVLLIKLLEQFQNKIQFKGNHVNFKRHLFLLGIYPFLLVGINSYSYTEFTSNTISMLVTKLFIYYLVCSFVFSLNRIKNISLCLKK